MTQRQEDILSMWNTTQAILMANETVWRSLNAFSTAADRFYAIHLEIDPNARIQQSAITGITLDKQALRRQLTAQVVQLAANMQAYAMVVQNNTLLDQVKFSPTHFDRLRDSMLPIMVRSLRETALVQGTALADYGITEATLTSLEQALEQYENMNAAPRVAIGTRKAAGTGIVQQIRQGNLQLELMDKLAGNFSTGHPEFVAAFLSARTVIHYSGHKSPKDDKGTATV